MKICLSGLTGSGKSTLGRRLAAHYGLTYFSGGNSLKRIIGGEKALEDPGWWEREGGRLALEMRKRDPTFDRRVDEELIKLAREHKDILLDSWTMAYLLSAEDKLAIFLKADLDVRAARVARRDGIGVEEARTKIVRRDEETFEIYRRIYGFRLGEDLGPFNLVIDTTKLNPDETFLVAKTFIDSWFDLGGGND